MQGLRPPIFRRYPARQVTGHLGQVDRARPGGEALRPESVRGQECRNPDGYNLLGQGLRADGDK